MASTTRRVPRYADAASELLSIDEAEARFAHEWVLFKVTGFDENQAISHGYVLAHSKSRKKLSEVVKRVHVEDPDALLYTFYGGSMILSPEEWQKRLRELKDIPRINALW
jgi:hypothetical protein